MKKIFFFACITVIGILGGLWLSAITPPPTPDTQPTTVLYTSDLIFNNVYSSVTLSLRVDNTGSSVTITNPSFAISEGTVTIRGGQLDELLRLLQGSVTVTNGSITTYDWRYENKVSSGISGIWTGVTSVSTDTVLAGNCVEWSFLYKSTDLTRYCYFTNSVYGTPIYLQNKDANSTTLDVPQTVYFLFSNLLVSDTVQYEIKTIQ